jgi:Cu+-exporting ATPase
MVTETPVPFPPQAQSVERLTLPISGLGCGGGGALSIERALMKLAGVQRAYINPATEMAYVEIDTDRCSHADLVRTIEGIGFRVDPPRRPWS